MREDRLLEDKSSGVRHTMEDEWYVMAYNVETALRQGGGIAGTDYTLIDLYTLAQPFVLEMFKGNKQFSYDIPFTEFEGLAGLTPPT